MTLAAAIVAGLRAQGRPDNVAGQRRFGITPKSEQLGLPLPILRYMARKNRRDHALALALWATAVHDARLIAAFAEEPKQVTRAQMEAWARDFDTWALVDAVCCTLFNLTSFAEEKAQAWSRRRAEFVKRAGFVLMAGMAVHRKELPDEAFLSFLPVLHREATDERHYVKKAVNWALRQIGQTQSATAPCSHRRGPADPPDRFAGGPLDCGGRPAGTGPPSVAKAARSTEVGVGVQLGGGTRRPNAFRASKGHIFHP